MMAVKLAETTKKIEDLFDGKITDFGENLTELVDKKVL